MKADNPIDNHLELYRNTIPEEVAKVIREVTDNMGIAKKICDSIFEDDSTPERAIQIYDRLAQALAQTSPDKNHHS